MRYRPWGPVDWTLSLSDPKRWHFFGTIGTEVRSLCSWKLLRQKNIIESEQFVQVQDIDSEKYRDRTQLALLTRRTEFTNTGGDLASVQAIELMAELFRIEKIAQRMKDAGPSAILDITSFPKRFFFPILRTLVNSVEVKNLLITYTSPANYAPEDEPLYDDIEPWRVLPGFHGSNTTDEMWIVSVGFMVESLRRYIGDNPNESMKILIPFPASLSATRRMWQAVASLEQGHTGSKFEKFRVETLNMSAAFDRICQLAGQPEKKLALAPFGPKPTSAAMCLYAMQKGASVHYPQPIVYHPDYSRGIRNNDPSEAVSAYWVKHEGENLYAI